jgi:beta-glucanase (GH16 family)
MKKLAAAAAVILCACNPNKTVLDAEFHPTDRGWGSGAPVWSDEFDDNSPVPNAGKWVVARFCGGHNGEKQCYTNQSSNIYVDTNAGHLIITARDETNLGRCDGDDISAVENPTLDEAGSSGCPATDLMKPDYDYSSARIHSRVFRPGGLHAWRYGRIEIRAKLPFGHGTWPAFWLLPVDPTEPWPVSGEIDMMETVNLDYPHQSDDFLQSDIHFCHWGLFTLDRNAPTFAQNNCSALNSPDWTYAKFHNPNLISGLQTWSPDLVTAFHTYAMEWSDGDLRFFVDDRLIGRSFHDSPEGHAPFRQPFYLIINLAIGGKWATKNETMPVNAATTGNWLQNPRRAELVLDWVRVYECVPDPLARNCIYEGDSGLGRQ